MSIIIDARDFPPELWNDSLFELVREDCRSVKGVRNYVIDIIKDSHSRYGMSLGVVAQSFGRDKEKFMRGVEGERNLTFSEVYDFAFFVATDLTNILPYRKGLTPRDLAEFIVGQRGDGRNPSEISVPEIQVNNALVSYVFD